MAGLKELRAELAKLNKERDKRNSADKRKAVQLTAEIDRLQAEAAAEAKVSGMSDVEKAAMRAVLDGDA